MPTEEGNFFTRKLGPLPVWAWAAIAIALLGAYAFWKKIGPFAGAGAASAGYPTVDPSSLASMIGAGSSPNLGVIADGGTPDPGTSFGPRGKPTHLGVSDALYNWRLRQGYGQSALVALPGASAGSR